MFRIKPSDTDLVMDYDTFDKWINTQDYKQAFPTDDGNKYLIELNDGSRVDIDIAFPDNSSNLVLEACKNVSDKIDNYVIAPLNILYTLKCSHRYAASVHFRKTLKDYHRLRDSKACKVDQDLLTMREQETYSRPRPKLNRSKDDFFDTEGITYAYDHDTLHQAVKLQDRPAYDYFKPDDKEVMVSKKMWDKLPLQTKINAVTEESYVLALERSQIPHGELIDPIDSFLIALQKVCTTITSGWFREFAYDHFYEVITNYRGDYVDKFKAALENGIVKSLSKL